MTSKENHLALRHKLGNLDIPSLTKLTHPPRGILTQRGRQKQKRKIHIGLPQTCVNSRESNSSFETAFVTD